MNWLDIVLLFLFAISVLTAFRNGLTAEVVRLVSVALALVLSVWLYGTAASFLLPYTNSKAVANFCGFLIVFCGVWLAGWLIGLALSRLLKLTGLSIVDRLLGAAFGTVRGLLLAAALVTALMAFTPGNAPPRAVVGSRVAPYVIDASRIVAAIAPYELNSGFRKNYEQAKDIWRNTLKRTIPSLPAARNKTP